MIPFCCAENGEILNLSQVVRITEVKPLASNAQKHVEVTTADGKITVYSGKAANIISSQVLVCMEFFQAWLKETTSPIITTGDGKASIM